MPGYSKDEKVYEAPIDCTSNMASPYDVTQGVRRCGANAESADACWPTAGGNYVLCLIDPFEKVLTLRPADGARTPLPPHEKSTRPIGIELEDGTRCRAVAGGAWSMQQDHPEHSPAYYACQGGPARGDFPQLWATPGSDSNGISMGPDGATVQIGTYDGPVAPAKIKAVYFVGMA